MTTWVKVYNSMPQNPKVLMAGERAAWLAVCGLCYANEHLTNGFIPRHALPVVAPGVSRPEALAAKLVAAGLWHEHEGGWQIHDYGEHQRSAEEIRERRAKDAARKAASRSDGSPRGQSADSTRNPSGVHAESATLDVEGRRQKAEKEQHSNAELRSAVVEVFAYWQERTNHPQAQPSDDRLSKIKARLKERQRFHDGDLHLAVLDCRRAVDGAAIGAFVDERGKRHDDIGLIFRNNEKLEDFMGRAARSNVRQLRPEQPEAIQRMNRWKRPQEAS